MPDRRRKVEDIAATAWWLLCPAAAIAIDQLTGGHSMRSVAGIVEVLAFMSALCAYRRFARLVGRLTARWTRG
jgi:hypothetical protein